VPFDFLPDKSSVNQQPSTHFLHTCNYNNSFVSYCEIYVKIVEIIPGQAIPLRSRVRSTARGGSV
jgi:hypothetical protein